MNERFKFRVWHEGAREYADCYCCSTSGFCVEGVVAEQCTGLMDKNGDLIYDNDFVRVIHKDTKDRPDLQVGYIWVDELNCRWIKFSKEELSWNDFCSLIDYDLTLEIEVIGNIHENPELLEQNNDNR